MERIFQLLTRRSLLKLLLALPFVRLMEDYLASIIGLDTNVAAASAPLKVAKVSELTQPWSSVRFTYSVKIKTKDVYKKDVVIEESIPGIVVRLPDDLAKKRGGGVKGSYDVIDLHCTHERCVSAFVADSKEARALADVEAKNPIIYCPCHRSVFDVAEGAKPIKGPAKQALWRFDFDVKGGDIVITGLDQKASIWDPGRPGALGGEYPVRPGEPGL